MILWKNGYIHTLEDEIKTYRLMATNQGVIVGFDEEIKSLVFDQEVDLKGHHLYPGFVDSHLHLLGYGQSLSLATLRNLYRKEEILKEVKKKVKLNVLFFEGYHPTDITKYDLNDIKADGPLVLRHSDNHSITVNDYILEKMKVKSVDGFITEEVSDQIIKHYKSQHKNELKIMLENSIKSLYKYGVTGGHSDDLSYYNGFHETLDIFRETFENMPFRAHLLMHHKVIDDFINTNLTFLDQSKYLQLGAVKIFYDGTFTSKTALLNKPYYRQNNKGLRIFKFEELTHLIKNLRKHDLPIAVHVIGDLGLKEVVDLLETYPVKKGLHDRIIHASLADLETIKRMKKLPIILDIQPQFIISDLPQILDIFSEVPEFIYPFKTYLDEGLIICGSSDAPIEEPSPLKGMYVAITRELKSKQIFQKEERLSRFQALKLYTTYANIPTYKNNRGLLKTGYIADFTIVSEDLLQTDIDMFLKDIVEMTVIDEKIVYKR